MNLSMIYTYREETVMIYSLAYSYVFKCTERSDLAMSQFIKTTILMYIFICKSDRVHWLFETIFFEILQVPYVVVLL